jgi:hypothetical protein
MYDVGEGSSRRVPKAKLGEAHRLGLDSALIFQLVSRFRFSVGT